MKTLCFLSNIIKDYRLYLILATFVFIFGGGKEYINIIKIIKKYASFIKENKATIWGLFIFPLLLTIAIVLKKPNYNESVENITVIISILMTLFFTFISFFDRYLKTIDKEDYTTYCLYTDYCKETKTIASYEVLISILILILCFIFPILSGIIKGIVGSCLYFLCFHLFMNLLILLKRYDNSI